MRQLISTSPCFLGSESRTPDQIRSLYAMKTSPRLSGVSSKTFLVIFFFVFCFLFLFRASCLGKLTELWPTRLTQKPTPNLWGNALRGCLYFWERKTDLSECWLCLGWHRSWPGLSGLSDRLSGYPRSRSPSCRSPRTRCWSTTSPQPSQPHCSSSSSPRPGGRTGQQSINITNWPGRLEV